MLSVAAAGAVSLASTTNDLLREWGGACCAVRGLGEEQCGVRGFGEMAEAAHVVVAL